MAESHASPHDSPGIAVIYAKKKYTLSNDQPSGASVYQLFGVPSGNKLFLETPRPSEPDMPIANDATVVHVKDGSHFYDLPPGTVG